MQHGGGPPVAYPISNVLINSLPEESRAALLPHLKAVALPVRTVLYEPFEPPRYVHFLTSGIASVVTSSHRGETTEVGTLGREGLPQAIHLLGSGGIPTRGFMQMAGTGLRMEFAAFERLFAADEPIRRAVLAYAQYHCVLATQIAGCNRMHGLEPRLARWLLMIQDRSGESVLRLTQEFLAEMIGSQRTTVGAVAGALQDRGLLEYTRGTIRLLHRRGLEEVACECYPITYSVLESLYARASERVIIPAPAALEETAV